MEDRSRKGTIEALLSPSSEQPQSADYFSSPSADQQLTASSSAGGTGSGMDDESDGRDDDVRMAVNALGIMRQGSLSDTPPSHAQQPAGSAATLQQHKRAFASRSASNASSTASSSAAASALYASSHSHSANDADSLLSSAATSPSRPASTHSPSELDDDVDVDQDALAQQEEGFIARVSQLPIVTGALSAYEKSKASSRVVKYGAGIVESSLSTISRPLSNNRQLGQLDEFAGRQLNRFGGSASPTKEAQQLALELHHDHHRHEEEDDEELLRRDYRGKELMGPPPLPRAATAGSRRTDSPHGSTSSSHHADSPGSEQAVAVVSRSRWQTVLTEAGGLGAAVSEESLKSLKYCLQWLLYATAHLDHQIVVLRTFIASLQRQRSFSSTSSSSNALVHASAAAHLTQIKHDVVETIRRVVDVVSRYAGAALPEQARRYVRQSILGLPVKWASAIAQTHHQHPGGAPYDRSTRGSSVASATSGASTPTGDRSMRMEADFGRAFPPQQQQPGQQQQQQAGSSSVAGAGSAQSIEEQDEQEGPLRPTEDAAERVLTFAVESLDMLRSVAQIFGESVEKAEAWIERLRIVGVDRRRQREAAGGSSSNGAGGVGAAGGGAGGSSSFEDSPLEDNDFAVPVVGTASALDASIGAGMKRRRVEGAGADVEMRQHQQQQTHGRDEMMLDSA